MRRVKCRVFTIFILFLSIDIFCAPTAIYLLDKFDYALHNNESSDKDLKAYFEASLSQYDYNLIERDKLYLLLDEKTNSAAGLTLNEQLLKKKYFGADKIINAYLYQLNNDVVFKVDLISTENHKKTSMLVHQKKDGDLIQLINEMALKLSSYHKESGSPNHRLFSGLKINFLGDELSLYTKLTELLSKNDIQISDIESNYSLNLHTIQNKHEELQGRVSISQISHIILTEKGSDKLLLDKVFILIKDDFLEEAAKAKVKLASDQLVYEHLINFLKKNHKVKSLK